MVFVGDFMVKVKSSSWTTCVLFQTERPDKTQKKASQESIEFVHPPTCYDAALESCRTNSRRQLYTEIVSVHIAFGRQNRAAS
jgi:hypothetical protein